MEICVRFLTILVAGLVACQAAADDPPAKKEDATQKLPVKVNLTLSKETTYFTKPVMEDGCINYIAALNEHFKQGITGENNAQLVLIQALGPKQHGKHVDEVYFRELGCQRPGERGTYFRSVGTLLDERDADEAKREAAGKIFDQADERPWSAQEFPEVKAWLDSNEAPLRMVAEAVKRPRYYSPGYIEDKWYTGFMGQELPYALPIRCLGNALVIRAMGHLHERRWSQARDDLLVTHRLARLISQSYHLHELLIAIAIENEACRGDLMLLAQAGIDDGFLREYRKTLDGLPPLVPFHENVALSERCMQLEAVQMFAKHGLPYLYVVGGTGSRGALKKPEIQEAIVFALFFKGIPWDPGLKEINASYERVVGLFKIKDESARRKAFDLLDDEVKKRAVRVGTQPETLYAGKRSNRSKAFVEMIKFLTTPAFMKIQVAEDRLRTAQRQSQIAFALEFHRREVGTLPEKLDVLSPKYMAAIPGDPFGEKFFYLRTEKGYRLWSVGLNGRNDEGRGMFDEPWGDDILVEMPMRPRQRE